LFFVTGDLHGDRKDFSTRKFGRIKKGDYVVVCGDFGFLWDGSKRELRWLENLGKKKYGILFVDGAHENFDLLSKYPVTDWNGGKAQVLSGNLVHLMRGQIYTINGKRIFTFGGGESADREMRTPHKTWWSDELPTEDEMQGGVEKLVSAGWQVDYIFSYEAPSAFRRFLEPGEYDLNALNVYLECVREKCRYQKWAFGNYHINRRLSAEHEVVFDDVLRLD
jgi:Predicted phosphoesterases, related to the Icc protein